MTDKKSDVALVKAEKKEVDLDTPIQFRATKDCYTPSGRLIEVDKNPIFSEAPRGYAIDGKFVLPPYLEIVPTASAVPTTAET